MTTQTIAPSAVATSSAASAGSGRRRSWRGFRRASWGTAPARVIALILRIGISLAIVIAVTFVFLRLVPVNATTAGFMYLVAILIIATRGGLVESSVASVAAMLCLNFFFLPPVGTLTIADPQNWVALFAFLATSLTASQLSARAKHRTEEALERRSEIEKLYSLSRALLLTDATGPDAKQVVQQIALTCGFPMVALYVRKSGEVHRAGLAPADLEDKLRESAVRSALLRDESRGVITTPVRLGGEPIGSLAVSSGKFSDAALNSLLNLVAIGLERTAAQKAVTRAEVARQSEELKSTLLDAMAHEFKTPLTSIKAVTTYLLSEQSSSPQPSLQEMISIVDESTDRLAKLVTEAIQLARIEGGTFRLNLGVHFPRSLVSGALRQVKFMLDERVIAVAVSDDLPPVRADAELIQIVISHLLDNAFKYSPASNPISVSAQIRGAKVILMIRDQGKGIPDEEQRQVFEKFYRGKNERHLKGTGMGLSIAREIMRAHGEEIWLNSSPGVGSEFSLSLPIASNGPRNERR